MLFFKSNGKESERGTITVFFCLILVVILALIFTVIEGARVKTAQTMSARALTTAMDSVLAEYYGPLWEEYHLFGLDLGYGGNQVRPEEMMKRLDGYMVDTLSPNRNVVGLPEVIDLYQISSDVLLGDHAMLMDYQGRLFVNEAVEYMKYKVIGNGLETFLSKLSLMETTNKVQYLYAEKEKVESELVEIDRGILKLMEYLDGISTKQSGIKTNQDGSLTTVPHYVKMICYGLPDQEKVGINQSFIFMALKDHYTDPDNYFRIMKEDFHQIDHINLMVAGLNSSYLQLNANISDTYRQLNELNSIPKKTKEIKKQISELQSQITRMETSRSLISVQLSEYALQKEQYRRDLINNINRVSDLCVQIRPKITAAISVIRQILLKESISETLVNGYEALLRTSQGKLNGDIYTGLEDDLKMLKRYSAGGEQNYRFADFKDTLELNAVILDEVAALLSQGQISLNQNAYEAAKGVVDKAADTFKSYRTDNLTLDYSTLVLNKQEGKNPVETIGELVKDGIMGLVMDSDQISKERLDEDNLPSVLEALSGEGEGGFDFIDFFQTIRSAGEAADSNRLLQSLGEEIDADAVLEDSINNLSQQLLFLEYLKDHFYSYPDSKGEVEKKPSALSYEQEYLLGGHSQEKENLSLMINKILLIRTGLDFVSLLGDQECRNEAQLAAAAIVGFTGLPVLVTITKTIILLAWAFSEALVDVSALLMVKEVPVLKQKIELKFTDLFQLKRTTIQEKASQMTNGNGFTLSYQDYLRIFLFIKNQKVLSYRAMDLIQENLQIRYEDNFYIQNCLYGFEVKADYYIKPKFIEISFVKDYFINGPKGFHYQTVANYSY